MSEMWQPVNGYEGIYEVSDQGRVRNVKRDRLRKPSNIRGYQAVPLCKGGKNRMKLLHRLVAEAFIPNHENKPQVNHINGNKADNRAENLEWVTPQENLRHAWETGLIPFRGPVKNPNYKGG